MFFDNIICPIRFEISTKSITFSHEALDSVVDPRETGFVLYNLVGMNFSDRSLRAFLNNFHLSLVFMLAEYLKKSLWYAAISDKKSSQF